MGYWTRSTGSESAPGEETVSSWSMPPPSPTTTPRCGVSSRQLSPGLEIETYHGSYIWFEAGARESLAPRGWRRWVLALCYCGFLPGGDQHLFEVKTPAGGSRWQIQINGCATTQARHHSIVWKAGVLKSGSKDEGNITGSGDGAGFIEPLAPGNHIGVMARAKVRF